MKKTIYLFALAGLSLAACGDNFKGSAPPDSDLITDGSNGSNSFPAAPQLGAQIDRMGRPAIGTALNHAFDSDMARAGSAKDAYNKDSSVATWQASYALEFMKNLAIIDAVDTGVCGNGICEDQLPGIERSATCPADCSGTNPRSGKDGCGNVPFWTADGSGNAMLTSYQTLGAVLADDELYLDTKVARCNAYLAVEFTLLTGASSPTACGGRAPSYDVIDYSYSVLTRGLYGLNPSDLSPVFGDGVSGPVAGTTDTTFPFLAPPHT